MSELNMRKRRSWESDVQGTETIQTQDSGFITLCTGPCNNVQDISVRKKRAEDDGRMPLKKMRFSNLTERLHVPMEFTTDLSAILAEDLSVALRKTKASDDGEAPRKKTRSSDKHCSDSSNGRMESGIVMIESLQDNAEDICHSFASTQPESYNPLPSSSECCMTFPEEGSGEDTDQNFVSILPESYNPLPSSSECCMTFPEEGSGEDTGQNFGSASPEEVFKMSTSANTSRVHFEKKYKEFGPLSTGGFGSVFEGVRKSDYLPVAIKHISIEAINYDEVVCNGKEYFIIREVALMLKAAGRPGSGEKSAAVSLYDWYILDQELILVMERPSCATNLRDYLSLRRYLDEHEAKAILRQLVDAAIEMKANGVFHRDIKLQNILVELNHDIPKVRIIDFGCGSLLEEKPYHEMGGTTCYFPPEWFTDGECWAGPTTVWQLGAVFYSLLKGHSHFSIRALLRNELLLNIKLSEDVKTLLCMCLNMRKMHRATLEELQLHPALRNISPPG